MQDCAQFAYIRVVEFTSANPVCVYRLFNPIFYYSLIASSINHSYIFYFGGRVGLDSSLAIAKKLVSRFEWDLV